MLFMLTAQQKEFLRPRRPIPLTKVSLWLCSAPPPAAEDGEPSLHLSWLVWSPLTGAWLDPFESIMAKKVGAGWFLSLKSPKIQG